MGRRCEEPHCLQIIPENLFQSHLDQHIAERLATEEFEQQHNLQNSDEALAQALGHGSQEELFIASDEDADYLMALALNREFRTEEEKHSFRSVQVEYSRSAK